MSRIIVWFAKNDVTKQVTDRYTRSVSYMFPSLSHLLTSYPPTSNRGNENPTFIVDYHIKTSIHKSFPFDCQMVKTIHIPLHHFKTPWGHYKKGGDFFKDFFVFFLRSFFLFFSLGQFSLLFTAFWSQNLWFACFLLHFGAKIFDLLLAFGFWLLAFGFGFWFLAFSFWLGFSIVVCIWHLI